jgi:hypothetical protein
MGALRINKVDGTSDFIDLSGFSSASLETFASESRITLTPIDPGIGNTVVTIERFRTQPQDSVWVYSSDAAYVAISKLPIEYGYPDLGTNSTQYREYDAVKIATSAIQGALGSSSSDEIVYSEITAIADNVGSIDDMKKLLDQIETQVNNAENLRADTIAECIDTTENGDTFTNSGCNCPSLTPGQPGVGGANTPCCEACGDAVYQSEILKIIDIAGPISKKHQYLFANVTVTSGPA